MLQGAEVQLETAASTQGRVIPFHLKGFGHAAVLLDVSARTYAIVTAPDPVREAFGQAAGFTGFWGAVGVGYGTGTLAGGVGGPIGGLVGGTLYMFGLNDDVVRGAKDVYPHVREHMSNQPPGGIWAYGIM